MSELLFETWKEIIENNKSKIRKMWERTDQVTDMYKCGKNVNVHFINCN